MSKSSENDRLLQSAKIKELIKADMLKRFEAFGDNMLQTFNNLRDWYNLTGNTLTSLGYGIYYDGKLELIATMEDKAFAPSPVCKKLRKGEVFWGETYDGDYIPEYAAFYFVTDTDGEFGSVSTFKWLGEGKVAPNPTLNKGYTILFTTGTEYSTLSDSIYQGMTHYRQLTQSEFLEFMKSFKPI